jgi:uncharacterized SAM-binding protein YcdF (DUF218 family)
VYFFLSKVLAPFLNLTNFLIFILIASYFFKKLFFKKTFRFINHLTILLLIIFSFFPIGKNLINTLEEKYLTNKIPDNYDYIIVLAGSEDAYTTSITSKISLNSSVERLIASVKLANKKKNSKIIFLGGSGYLKEHTIDESDVARNFFIDINFDLKRVIFVNDTRNTIENLKKLKKLNIKNEESLILITSAFHMDRALLISKKLNLNLIPYAVDFRSYSGSGKDGFVNYYQVFSLVGNLRSLNLYFREFLGIIAVKILM